ncbi:hypothetical protein Tco_0959822 [Tanacetum coccineum]
MTTLTEFMIIAGVDNHPSMLEKSLYDSWKSRMELYIDNRENGKTELSSTSHGPLFGPTVVLKEAWHLLDQRSLAVLVFNQGDDLIACLNKEMNFLTTKQLTIQEQQVTKNTFKGRMDKVKSTAYNDMQQKIKWLQAQLGDPKGKSKYTPCVSDTLDPLPQKFENANVELEVQVQNYEKENAHLKTAYKNLFDTINLFDKVFEQKDTTKGTSTNNEFANQSTERKPSLQSLRNTFIRRQPNIFQSERPNFSKTRVPQKVNKTNDFSNLVTSNSVPTTKESKVVENDKVIAPRMFRINHFKNFKEEKYVPNKPIKASVRINPITVSQLHVITKKVANSDSNGFSST